jgi:hypothetical protein
MRDADGKLLGISFCENHSVSKAPTMEFPKKWNRKVEKEHVVRSKVCPFSQFYLWKEVFDFSVVFSCPSQKLFCQF